MKNFEKVKKKKLIEEYKKYVGINWFRWQN